MMILNKKRGRNICVLIVAECNVNMAYNNDFDLNVLSFNSSRV